MVFSIDTPATEELEAAAARDGLRPRPLRGARVTDDANGTAAALWPEPVERVASFLRDVGAEARLEELERDTPHGRGAADAIGCTLSQIVKSLVLDVRRNADRRPRPGRPKGGHAARSRALLGARRVAVASAAEVRRGDRLQARRSRAVPARARVGRARRPRAASAPRSCGQEQAPTGTSSASRRRSSCGSRAVGSRTSCSNHHNLGQRRRTEETPMQETAKIWMNGELVDWADATVHVGVHGLHYGTGAFEGIRAYETPRGPAVFRLADHLQRLHDSAKLLYMDVPYSVEELRTGDARPRARERPARLLHPADRVLRLRLARRPHAREPGRDGDHELAVGRLPRRGLARRRGSPRRSRPGRASART